MLTPKTGIATCMSVVGEGLEDTLGGEVGEGEVTEVGVSLNVTGDNVNRGLLLPSAEGMGDVGPMFRSVG